MASDGGRVNGPGPADDDLVAAVVAPAVWTGQPVTCATCAQTGDPVMGEFGWALPIHRRTETTFPYRMLVCPGSMTPVTAMQVPTDMSDRIEQHVVDAMPPRINDDWDTP